MNDEQLLLLYYGEHDDPELAARVARDPELRRRFEHLSRSLEAIEGMSLPERSADYGAEVWQRLEPRLAAAPATQRWWRALLQPRLSFAGAAAVLLIAAMAFTLGRQAAVPEIDPRQLLAREVAAHLLKTDALLTGIANGDQTASQGEWAQQLLLPNRLYRATADRRTDPHLKNLLLDLEAALIELANASPDEAADAQLKSYVENNLLMRVRMMRAALETQPERA